MKKYLLLIVLISSSFCFAQVKKIILFDAIDNEKINDVKILSDKGIYLTSSNSQGLIVLDFKHLEENKIQSIETSHFLYEIEKLEIDKLPDTLKMVKKINQLEEVIISRNKNAKYYKVKVYFRSWRLLDNKLKNFAEGTKEVFMPYDKSKSNKEYYTEYVTYKDSSSHKNFVDISFGGDGYLFTKIPAEDYFTRYKHLYKLNKNSETDFDLLEDSVNVGYVRFDINNLLSEVNKNDVAENIKFLGKSLSYKNYAFERWKNDTPRHLSMSRNVIFKEISTKNKSYSIETVTELFVEDIEYSEQKPEKYKNLVNPDKSFFSSAFFKTFRTEHPLQKDIENQIQNIQKNENTYN